MKNADIVIKTLQEWNEHTDTVNIKDVVSLIENQTDTLHEVPLDPGTRHWIASRLVFEDLIKILNFEGIMYISKFLHVLEHRRLYAHYDEFSSTIMVKLDASVDRVGIRKGISLLRKSKCIEKLDILSFLVSKTGELLKDGSYIRIHRITNVTSTTNGGTLYIRLKVSVHKNECINNICKQLIPLNGNEPRTVFEQNLESIHESIQESEEW